MQKDDLIAFLGKKVRIRVKNGYTYGGFLKELHEDSIELIDWKIGLMLLALDNVVEIYLDEGEEFG